MFSTFVTGNELRTNEPVSFEKVVQFKDNTKWNQAMEEEIDSLRVNGTWKLIPKPKNQKLVECKQLFKLKGSIFVSDPPRFKARLEVKGYT